MLFYFFPGANSGSEVDLSGTALDGESVAFGGPTDGPGETERGMLAAAGDGAGMRFDGKHQTWRRCNGGRFWIGWWTDRKPRPEHLALREMIFGHQVMLLDGHEWMVPLARPFAGGEVLPQVTTLGEDGEPVRLIADRYRALREHADRLYDDWLADIGGGAKLNQDDADRMAVAALGTNYRIGKYEAAALELLDTTRTREVLRALIDLPTIEALIAEKKTDDIVPAG